MGQLALLGGKPQREKAFPGYKVIGKEERAAAAAVVGSGILSGYIGAEHPDFMGGTQVRRFEEAWANAFQTDHAITVNSATSGLYAAVGAAGVGA